MEHRIETRKTAVGIAYRLTGDYTTCDYGKAWQCLTKYCEENKEVLDNCRSDVEYMNMYYDGPDTGTGCEVSCGRVFGGEDHKPKGAGSVRQSDTRRRCAAHHHSRWALCGVHPQRALRETW